MSLAQKFQEGGTTPTLYSFYGKQYDYNDLAQAADQGLNEYLATLKRGEKDSDDFRTAYTNIMAGIKDGSITFDNGQFHDSKGRYTNSDKKNKDYYGLIANYIYGKMGQSGVYKKPEETPWDASTNVKKALMQELYNSDAPNLQDFLDLDAQKDGVRAITNRSARLANAFQSLADNWDNRFSGYSDDDRNKYRQLLGEAATALRDGTIDPGDYLSLSRAVGGVDFREMMATGTPTVQTNAPQVIQTTQAPQVSQTPQIKTRHASLADSSYNPETISRMTSIMSRVPTKGLIDILRNSFYSRNYRFGNDRRIQSIFGSSNISSKAGVTATLNALGVQGVLKNADPDNPDLFYIPGMRTKKGTAWVWDKANNIITEMLVQNIPYLNQQVPIDKQGGILYAREGDTFNNIYASAGDIGYGTYLNQIFNNDEMLNWMGSHYNGNDAMQRYSDYVKNNVNQRYTAGINDYNNNSTYSDSDAVLNFNRGYQNNGDTANYILFGNNKDDYSNRKGGIVYNMGVTWSRPKLAKGTGDSWNEDQSKAYIDGAKGLQTYSRVASLTDSGITSGKFGKWGDAWKARGATGAYYYIADGDTSGKGQWIPTNDTTQKGYVAFDSIQSEKPQQTTTNTKITPTQQPEKQPSWWSQNKQEVMDNALPLAAEATRLGLSLRANNKIADILKKATKSVLKNTYELYSPVTGAFSEMQLRNRQAADVRRQAAQPYTSDASLNAARSLDANRQAIDLEHQGFLADDKEILRTKQEALKRQEDNIARRTDVANFNRASINQADREKADIEAQRLNANHQGVDNFIANNIVTPLKEKAAYNLGQRRTVEQNRKYQQASFDMASITRQQDYQKQQLANYYANEERKIYRKYQDDFTRLYQEHASDENYNIRTSPEYQKYEDEIMALRQQQSRDAFDMSNYFDTQNRVVYNHIYNNRGSNSHPFTTDSSIQQQNWYRRIQSNKGGGKLSLTTQYLLNKVIK